MHYYQFNIADYRKDTMHLSRLEHSIYRDLIDWYYLDEKPIPLETQVVMRRLRLDTEEEAKALQKVLFDFFVSGEGWIHHRIEKDILDYHSMVEKNQTNGKLGGRPKKTQSVPSGLPDETESKPTRNPNQEPITNNHKPIESKAIRAPRFDAQAHLVSIGVPADLSSDWIKLRKTKRAEVTKTAIEGIASEASKAGLPLDAALRECCARGWSGFKADWLLSPQARASPFNTIHDQRAATIAALTGRSRNERTDERDITGEAVRVA